MKNKILCCILHTEQQPKQYEAIEKTWGASIDHMYYSDHEDASKNIVKVSDERDYKSCVEKNAKVFKILINDNRYNHYDYYFFVDDDTYVNTAKLRSSIEKDEFNEDKIYGHTHRDKDGGNWLHGGAGYLMNRKVLKKFENCEIVKTARYSDVNVQNHAFHNGVIIEKRKGFNPCSCLPPDYSGDPFDVQIQKCPEPFIEQFTFHYMKGIDLMVHIQNRLKKEYK